MKKHLVSLLTLFVLATSFSAQAKMVFRQGNGAEPQSLDPQVVTGIIEVHIVMGLLEPLLNYDPKTLAPLPGMAEKWETSEDGLTYIFHIRKNALWSNGDKVTAHDFVYSWHRYLHPELGSEYAYMLYPIKNAEAFNKGQIKDIKEVGFKAQDDYTFVVTLEKPTPYFLSIAQFPGTAPVHKATIEKFGGMTNRDSKWFMPGNMVNNGPFLLKSWVMNDKIVLTKNPKYWDKDNVKLDEVELYPTENVLTEEKMFRSGKIHKTYELPTEKIATYKEKNPELLVISPYLGSYYYWFNSTKAPFNNPDFRKALTYAIDREKIVNYVTKGGETPAYSVVPPNTGGFTSKFGKMFDVAKAKDYLAKAGYPDGKGFPNVKLLYNTNAKHKKIAEVAQQMWKKNLGIDIDLVNEDWKVYLDSTQNQNYDIARAGWIGDYNDPNTFFDMFTTTNGNNKGKYSNPNYDKIIEQSQNTLDQTKRMELFHQADQILYDDMPVLPFYIESKVYVISPKVKGWYPTLLDVHPLKNVYIEE